MRWIGAAAAAVLLSGAVAPALGQTEAERIVSIDTLNVRDVLYHLGGGGGNGLALIDEINGGVVLIDTKPPGWGDAMREAVEQVTDLPVTTIVNTHAHEEHAGSNAEFPDAVTIVAHANARAAMLRDGRYAEGGPGLPTTTFTDRFTLLDDLDRIDLYHFGPAHTDGDVVVVFPEKGVAYLGGLFPDKAVPVIDLERGGSGLAFPDTLDRVVAAIDGGGAGHHRARAVSLDLRGPGAPGAGQGPRLERVPDVGRPRRVRRVHARPGRRGGARVRGRAQRRGGGGGAGAAGPVRRLRSDEPGGRRPCPLRRAGRTLTLGQSACPSL